MAWDWRPIETVPEGEHVALYWLKGERGGGGVECATIVKIGSTGEWSYWTHGGPNAGDDWEPRCSERPTHWAPIEYPAGR